MKSIRFWTVAALLYAVAIFIGSAIPGPDMPQAVLAISDKVLHMSEYAVLGVLLHRAFSLQQWWPVIARRAVVFAIIGASMYAASDEIHQMFVPGRMADAFDWLADTAGAIIGVLVSAQLQTRSARRAIQR